MTRVKICGLKTVEHALAAIEYGADMLGFMFAPSRRQVTPEQVQSLVRTLADQSQRKVTLVGVFVNEAPAVIVQLAEQLGLDQIQLSGDEDARIMEQLGQHTVLKAVRLNGTPAEQGWLDAGVSTDVQLLVDAHLPGSYGGTGVVGDWDQAAALARQRPIMLAGGLTPENVGAAIRRVQPWGVDVSSGVETDGVKDAAKIQAFIAAVRAADHAGETQAC